MDTYCVEYDQENGIISDLDTMEVSMDGGKDYLLRTQKKSSPPAPGLLDWENIRNNLDDGRSVVSYPKICNLFSPISEQRILSISNYQ